MAIGACHLHEFAERTNLLAEFLPVADDLGGGRPGIQGGLLGPLDPEKPVHAVQRHPAVVADDPAPPVRVRQAGDDVGAAGREHLGRVGVEDAVVVGLAVPGEDLPDRRVQRVSISGQALLHHPQAAVGHDRAAQRRVGLQPDDQLLLPVDVAGRMARDRRRDARIDVVDPTRPLIAEHAAQARPQRAGALGRPGQERRLTAVRGHVGLDEVTDVDPVQPAAASEALPWAGGDAAAFGPDQLDGRTHDLCLPHCRSNLDSLLIGLDHWPGFITGSFATTCGPHGLSPVGRAAQTSAWSVRGGVADDRDQAGQVAHDGGDFLRAHRCLGSGRPEATKCSG